MKSSAAQALTVAGGVARLLVGLFFVVSACAKIFALDTFEVYIYSYGFMPLGLVPWAARLCIGVELLVGVTLAVGYRPRLAVLAATLLTVAFSLFLGYAALIGRTDSCHCMGQLAHLSPVQSLLKNALLLALLCLAAKGALWQLRPTAWLAVVVALLCLALPFAVRVPDDWIFGPTDEQFGHEALAALLDEPAEADLSQGHHVLALVTPGCAYCNMAIEKLLTIERRHDLDTAAIVFLGPNPDDGYASRRDTTPGGFAYTVRQMPKPHFMAICRGQWPTILLLDGREVVASCHLRNISERQIANHLSCPEPRRER
ncbi:MAG: DoxX family protein [Bacteroidales bacterium]|nr:DoxX family protein [Bacteroidales bacterium]